MRNISLLVAAFLTSSILISTASYANVSLKGEAFAATPSEYNWSGFYAGLNAGLVRHTLQMTDNQAVSYYATIQQTGNPKLTGGLQVGYRTQMDLTKASGVFGLELAANFANDQFKKEYGSPFALYQLESTSKLKDIVLLELTGGIAADRTLLFVAAGLSWVNLSGSVTNVDGLPFFNTYQLSKKEFGTALGAGIEYAFTQTLSARFKMDVVTPNSYTVSDNTGNHYLIANSIIVGTLGINYLFA